ncbi:penicillin-binding protein 2 [Streptococcus suis]|nr:penicillin-binding protein 2 [Streptococcus suis]NQP18421.1 penicillin-binding protein 2 [Streptococcus suis]
MRSDVSNKLPSRVGREDRIIPRRLNMLFAIVVFLFSVLIARLVDMQLINKDFYVQKLETASQKVVSRSSVRGQIYDAKGLPLVENKLSQVVSFTRSNKITAKGIRDIAEKLVAWVSLPEDIRVSERDKADYLLADTDVYEKVVAELPREKRFGIDGNRLSEGTIYANAVESLDPKDLQLTEAEEKVVYLFTQMNKAGFFETVRLATQPLNAEQIALIASHEQDMPGVTTVTNWDRLVKDTSLSSIIGTVTTEQVGLPAEDAEDYLAKGYYLNDRVGTAYLEKQYEGVLQGQRELKEVKLNRNGNVESIDTIQVGQKGNNIKLTIDLAFQDGVNAILKKYFEADIAAGHAAYSDGIYAVAIDPNTGAILALSGYEHDKETNQVRENALGTITNVFVPGSIVKGATLAAGWEHGAISGNQVLTDQPIQFADSSPIKSWFTDYGSRPITAVEALQYSSNTYMLQIALNMLGQPYQPGMILKENDQLQTAMGELRTSFGQFGLGVSTGIDLPLESTGYIPKEFSLSNYLTNSFGQFDNYTPLQMAQYAATVANGGRRLAPHLVQGIYHNDENGGLGSLKEEVATKELNQVDLSPEEIALIQEGFYQVVYGGSSLTTGRKIAEGASVPISAKTGTAETFVQAESGQLKNVVNTNIVAYAPSQNPQIAIAVVLPNLTDFYSDTSKMITTEIVNLYNSLYPMN